MRSGGPMERSATRACKLPADRRPSLSCAILTFHVNKYPILLASGILSFQNSWYLQSKALYQAVNPHCSATNNTHVTPAKAGHQLLGQKKKTIDIYLRRPNSMGTTHQAPRCWTYRMNAGTMSLLIYLPDLLHTWLALILSDEYLFGHLSGPQ